MGRSAASLARILSLCVRPEGGGPVADPAALRAAVTDLRRVILSRAGEEIRAAEEPTSRRARRLLVAALVLAVASSAVFARLYSRLVRERRTLEDRLVRSEKLSALATLAAGIAHELNNPMATIAMSAEALASRLAADSDQGRYATAIGEEAERCRSIIADLSDLARGASLDLGPVDALELAREAARAVARRFPAVAVEVAAEPSAGLPLVSADRGKLRQLLVNLLLNGAEASEPGGRVTLTVTVGGARLRFAVKDEGRGIPRHLLDRIFDPFFTGKPKGLGLGLTICHRIAEMHGGELSVASEGPGRGATFTFLLPLEVPRA